MKKMTKRERWGSTGARLFEGAFDVLPAALLTFSGIGMAFVTKLFDYDDPKEISGKEVICFVLGVFVIVAFAFSSLWMYLRGKMVSALEHSRDELVDLIVELGLHVQQVMKIRLRHVAEELEFSGRERISNYTFGESKFTIVARYSESPELSRRGRGVYPVDQGYIGESWRSASGRIFKSDIPDPNSDWTAYCEVFEKESKMEKDVTTNLTMRCRSIGAYVLMDQQEMDRKFIVVFESELPDGLKESNLEKFVYGHSGRELSQLATKLEDTLPQISKATEAGF